MSQTTLAQGPQSTKFSAESLEWFERQVRPIFAEHCSSCHSGTVGKLKGELSLDTRAAILTGGESGPAVVPGKPDESLLIEAVRRESFEMPPEKPLSDRELRTLVRWVEIGAPWPEDQAKELVGGGDWRAQRFENHWAWQPVKTPSIPNVTNDDWSAGAIDRFILAGLRESSIQPAPTSDPHALLRRLYFDLTGLPPFNQGPSEMNEQNYADHVEQLMGSPQFGVRWGRHWLDLVRYAETLGHEFDYPLRYAWHYRDAVIDAINIDVPYDHQLAEHLAGDLITPARRHPLTGVSHSLAMTGFWWLGDSVHAPVDLRNDFATRVDNQIDVFSKAFLGMTVACARCHDHKFDAIGTSDYYGLAGVIESSRREYAITDPTGSLARHWSRTASEVGRADQAARSVFSQLRISDAKILAWLSAYRTKLRALDAQQIDDELPATSPFHALRAELGGKSFKKSFNATKLQAAQSQEDFERWESESVLWASFSQGIPPSWQLSATQYSAGMTPELIELWNASEGAQGLSFDWYSETLPLPNRLGVFSSQKFGRKTSLLLTSPSFTLDHNMICVKMRGKSTQASVIVNNYFMNEFHSLLFKDTRKPINQLEDSGWVTHAGDLNKYLGEPTYLSIYDEGQAWFEIEEVRFANRPPPDHPSRLTLELLQEEIQTSDELLSVMCSRVTEALNRFQADAENCTSLAARESIASGTDREGSQAISVVRHMLRASLKHDLAIPESLRQLAVEASHLRELDGQAPEPTMLLATAEGTPRDAYVAIRGNPHELGEIVPRGCFESLAVHQSTTESSSGRLELAETLANANHPLSARVMVNRVWHHLMGRGLVSSPDNFGVLGGRPSHPELLDYLTSEFVKHGWSIKWLVREIVTSKTYQLSSAATEQHRQLDADGSLWSHRPVRRLTAEALRDAMLAAANSLDLQLAGPSVAVHLSDQMTGRGRPKDSGPLDGDNRRSTYVEVRRNFLDPFLVAFDFPMPSTSAGDRNQSNVPAQALGLLNDPLVLELASRWAASTESIADPAERAAHMIWVAYSRPATPVEINRCLEYVESGDRNAWTDLAHVLLNAKEFSYLK